MENHPKPKWANKLAGIGRPSLDQVGLEWRTNCPSTRNYVPVGQMSDERAVKSVVNRSRSYKLRFLLTIFLPFFFCFLLYEWSAICVKVSSGIYGICELCFCCDADTQLTLYQMLQRYSSRSCKTELTVAWAPSTRPSTRRWGGILVWEPRSIIKKKKKKTKKQERNKQGYPLPTTTPHVCFWALLLLVCFIFCFAVRTG